MNKLFLTICVAVMIADANAAEPLSPQEPQVAAAIKEVQAQQAQMAENQARIESQLAVIGEAIRVARIYASRAGNAAGK